MKLQVAPRTLALIVAAVVAVLAMGGWFVLVGAQRSSATSLEQQIADAQINLETLQETTETGKGKPAAKPAAKRKADSKASQLAQLQAAFPTSVEMPSLLLQIQRLAGEANVSLESFAPSTASPLSGYDSIPIDVTVTGRYRAIQRFVHDLRTQAGSVKGRVHAEGRLFSVETVGITAAPEGLPNLSATIMVDAFVYSGVVPPTDPDASATTTTAEGTS